jgi:hypothetical protein
MPVCPFGTHRLRLGDTARCRQCGGDLSAYAALRTGAIRLYNEARRRWDANDEAGAAALLAVALDLDDDVAEAHWLLGLVHLRNGQTDDARACLERAHDLGAAVDVASMLEPAAVASSDAPSPPDDAGIVT